MAGIDPKYGYLTLGLLAFCTVAGLIVVYKLRRDVNEDDAPPTEKEVLGPLERAFYSGLMTEEEFKRIGSSMAKQKDGSPPPPKPRKAQPSLAETADTATSTEIPEPDTEEDPTD